jgi:hypothetical protein
MAELSLFWGGTAVGDAGPYDDDEFSDFIRDLFICDNTVEGVIPNNLSELLVTNPAGLTIRIASGAAIVDGKLYRNTANKDFTAALPVFPDVNYYTIVLRKTWATQEVRLAILGPSVVGYPVETSTDIVVWEIFLAKLYVTSAALVVISDFRVFASVPKPILRQGSNAIVWSACGTTNYTETDFTIQCGAVLVKILDGTTNAHTTVTFPKPFLANNTPLIFTTIESLVPVFHMLSYSLNATETDADIYAIMDPAAVGDQDIYIAWMAIGKSGGYK